MTYQERKGYPEQRELKTVFIEEKKTVCKNGKKIFTRLWYVDNSNTATSSSFISFRQVDFMLTLIFMMQSLLYVNEIDYTQNNQLFSAACILNVRLVILIMSLNTSLVMDSPFNFSLLKEQNWTIEIHHT